MNRVFVTGGRGMLGASLVDALAKTGRTVCGDLAGGTRTDVADWPAIERAVEASRADAIWHLAAATDVDRCELEPSWAFRVNGLATENLARLSKRLSIPIVYVSTSAVFGSHRGVVHSELDAPSPANVYGRTKLYGERAVEALAGDWYILRAGWMVGGWERDKKFVYRIVTMITGGKSEVRAVDDKYGTPTFTDDFSRKAIELVDQGRFGTWHVVNRGHASRYEMARVIIDAMHVTGKVALLPVGSAHFPLAAPRAGSEMIEAAKLEALGLQDLPPWEEALREYVSRRK
jgi:dTDP-4-dehydrorhamnose reductase